MPGLQLTPIHSVALKLCLLRDSQARGTKCYLKATAKATAGAAAGRLLRTSSAPRAGSTPQTAQTPVLGLYSYWPLQRKSLQPVEALLVPKRIRLWVGASSAREHASLATALAHPKGTVPDQATLRRA